MDPDGRFVATVTVASSFRAPYVVHVLEIVGDALVSRARVELPRGVEVRGRFTIAVDGMHVLLGLRVPSPALYVDAAVGEVEALARYGDYNHVGVMWVGEVAVVAERGRFSDGPGMLAGYAVR